MPRVVSSGVPIRAPDRSAAAVVLVAGRRWAVLLYAAGFWLP
jgi:hypothetical protein